MAAADVGEVEEARVAVDAVDERPSGFPKGPEDDGDLVEEALTSLTVSEVLDPG